MDKYWQASGESIDPFAEILGWVGWILTLIPFGIARIFGIQFMTGYRVD